MGFLRNDNLGHTLLSTRFEKPNLTQIRHVISLFNLLIIWLTKGRRSFIQGKQKRYKNLTTQSKRGTLILGGI